MGQRRRLEQEDTTIHLGTRLGGRTILAGATDLLERMLIGRNKGQ